MTPTIKYFSKHIFIISTAVFTLLLIPSFLAAFGEDEGTLGTNIIWVTFAKLFYVLRCPTHTLFWTTFSSHGLLYLLGLLINCMFYGFITERVISFFKNRKMLK